MALWLYSTSVPVQKGCSVISSCGCRSCESFSVTVSCWLKCSFFLCQYQEEIANQGKLVSNAKQKAVVRISVLSPGKNTPAFFYPWFALRRPRGRSSQLELAVWGWTWERSCSLLLWSRAHLSLLSPVCRAAPVLRKYRESRLRFASIWIACYFRVSLSWPPPFLSYLYTLTLHAANCLYFFHKISLFLLLLNNSWKRSWSL